MVRLHERGAREPRLAIAHHIAEPDNHERRLRIAICRLPTIPDSSCGMAINPTK
jgi:hypothetical protein